MAVAAAGARSRCDVVVAGEYDSSGTLPQPTASNPHIYRTRHTRARDMLALGLIMLPLACAASIGPCLSLWLLSGLIGWPVKALWFSTVKCG